MGKVEVDLLTVKGSRRSLIMFWVRFVAIEECTEKVLTTLGDIGKFPTLPPSAFKSSPHMVKCFSLASSTISPKFNFAKLLIKLP